MVCITIETLVDCIKYVGLRKDLALRARLQATLPNAALLRKESCLQKHDIAFWADEIW